MIDLKIIIKKKSFQVVLNTFFLAIIKLSSNFFSLIYYFIANRFFGTVVLGINSLSTNILLYIDMLIARSYGSTLTRLCVRNSLEQKTDIKKVYLLLTKKVLLLSSVISVFLFFISPYISGNILQKAHLSAYLQIASIGIIPLCLTTVNVGLLKGYGKIKESTIITSSLITLSEIFIILIIVQFNKDDLVINLAYVLSLIISFVASTLFVLPILKNNNSQCIYQDNKDELNKDTKLFYRATFLEFISKIINIFIIGRYSTDINMAIFNIATKITLPVSLALGSFTETIVKEMNDDTSNRAFKEFIQKATKITWWFGIPTSLTYLFISEYILKFLGKDLASNLSILVVRIMILNFLVEIVLGPLTLAFRMSKYLREYTSILNFSQIAKTLIKLILVPYYGIFSIVIIDLIFTLISNILLFFMFRKYYGFYTINLKKIFSFDFVKR